MACYCGSCYKHDAYKYQGVESDVPTVEETEEKDADPNRYEWYAFNDLGTYRLARRRVGTVDLETVGEFFSKEALDQVARELNQR